MRRTKVCLVSSVKDSDLGNWLQFVHDSNLLAFRMSYPKSSPKSRLAGGNHHNRLICTSFGAKGRVLPTASTTDWADQVHLVENCSSQQEHHRKLLNLTSMKGSLNVPPDKRLTIVTFHTHYEHSPCTFCNCYLAFVWQPWSSFIRVYLHFCIALRQALTRTFQPNKCRGTKIELRIGAHQPEIIELESDFKTGGSQIEIPKKEPLLDPDTQTSVTSQKKS